MPHGAQRRAKEVFEPLPIYSSRGCPIQAPRPDSVPGRLNGQAASNPDLGLIRGVVSEKWHAERRVGRPPPSPCLQPES